MPPKAQKKTKAEKEAERKAKEEEEAKRAELEEKRLQEEAARREEEERRLQAERVVRREEELSRLALEAEQAAEDRVEHSAIIKATKAEHVRMREWERYVACKDSLDVTNEAMISTYISEVAAEPCSDADQVLARAEHCDAIALSLRERVIQVAFGERDESKRNASLLLLRRLYECSAAALDSSTAYLLSHWDEYVKAEEASTAANSTSDRLIFERCGTRMGLWCNIVMKAFRLKTIDFGGILTDIPRPLSTARIALRNMYIPHEHGDAICNDQGVPHSGRLRPIGGTFYLELLSMPPPPAQIAGWCFRPETELSESIVRRSYPLDGANAAVAPAIRAQFTIPGGVLVQEDEPSVAAWNPSLKEWTTEGIEEVEWSAERRSIRFHTHRVGALALVQDRALDFPLKDWSLKPVYEVDISAPEYTEPPSTTQLDLVTARNIKLSFRVRAGEVCLRGSEDLPQDLVGISERWCGPGAILMALADAGVGLVPQNDDADFLGLSGSGSRKSPELEEALCYEIASLAAAFEFQKLSSALEASLGPGRVAFQTRESSAFTGGDCGLTKFSLALMERDDASDSHMQAPSTGLLPAPGVKSCLLEDAQQKGAKLKTAPAEGQQTHIRLRDSLRVIATEEALERAEVAAVGFRDTVKCMLALIRPFSFSG